MKNDLTVGKIEQLTTDGVTFDRYGNIVSPSKTKSIQWAIDAVNERKSHITGYFRDTKVYEHAMSPEEVKKDYDESAEITGETSDGYHTFNELYEHRHALFGALSDALGGWKSKLHDDGSSLDGWFIAGIKLPAGMVTYHIPIKYWNDFPGMPLKKAPPFDGHNSNDVIERLQKFWKD